MFANYHTHTHFCGHAQGKVCDYAKAAEAQCTILGISDHAPQPGGEFSSLHMKMNDIDAYKAEIEEARQVFPRMKILQALECEYIPKYHNYYKDELLGKHGCQYLIGSAHWTPVDGEWLPQSELKGHHILQSYARYIITTMESGLFAFIAHPDVFGVGADEWDKNTISCSREILKAAASLNVPLEINGNGMRLPVKQTPDGNRWQYPWRPFWELAAEYNITVICNSDAHDPKDVLANIVDGQKIASEYGLTLAEFHY